MSKISIKYGLLTASALCVVACSPLDKPQDGSAEELLAAEGAWTLAEDRTAANDPLKAHMQTRKKVDPTSMDSKAYTHDAETYKKEHNLEFRVLNLETQMSKVRADLNTLLQDHKNIGQKPRGLGHVLAEASPDKKPAMTKAVPAKTKPAVGGPLRVTSVRMGQHPGKTRFVMDLSQAAPKYTAEIDNAEKLLIVELPGAGWSAAAAKTFTAHPLIKGYSAQPAGDGTRLVMELKKPAKLVMNTAMKPNAVHGHRVVLDIAAQ